MIKQTLQILGDLIAFDTTSRNSNLALIGYVQALLDEHDVSYSLTFNADKTKANLFATIGDDKIPGIVFSGHTDVVPVDGQNWSSNPFELIEKDGKVYGRGTCDMKGFIAVCLAMIEPIKQAKLPIPVHFAFSYDEEVGCLGVRELIAELAKRAIKPLACIVGEPTNMQVVSAHKGIFHAHCKVAGCAGHSSMPAKGVNAIYVGSNLINKIQEIGSRLASAGPFDLRFSPPHSTVHVGVIQGGTSLNIIPQHCEFEYEVRNIPSHDPQTIADELADYAQEALLPDMKAVSDYSDISWSNSAAPSLDTPETAPINAWMQHVLGDDQPIKAVSYATEAGLFSNIAIQTVVCGPGAIEQAHRPDEYVEIDELKACIAFMQNAIIALQDGLQNDPKNHPKNHLKNHPKNHSGRQV